MPESNTVQPIGRPQTPSFRLASDRSQPRHVRQAPAPPRYSAPEAPGCTSSSRAADRLLLGRIASPPTSNRHVGACRIFWTPAFRNRAAIVCSIFDAAIGACGSHAGTTAPWIHRSPSHDPGRRPTWTLSRAHGQTTSPTPSDRRLPTRLVLSAAGRRRLAVSTRLRT
jgi:hypothetical protein